MALTDQITRLGADERAEQATKWARLARAAQRRRLFGQVALIAVLTVISLPIILPYLWMILISFTAKLGEPDASALWSACLAIFPAVVVIAAASALMPKGRVQTWVIGGAIVLGLCALAILIGPELHLSNYRFMVTPNLIEDRMGEATAGGQFPWVWTAFGNSLILAGAQTVIVVTVSTLAGYYLSRFAFPARAGFLQALLVLQAFPAMTLIIPIFLIAHHTGLLNTLVAPMLVITALELPFFIFIMKGFFDAVPWDIEMSALVDGASRREAFAKVVLPQVRVGMIAIGIFAFIKGWEEYVFVSSLRTGSSYWVMSLYLYYVSEDVMGVDYGLVAAVAVFYLAPAMLLYLFTQKYLTQMSVGGIKG